MSWVGMVTGLPSAGLRMLLVDSIRIRASACASADSGTCTAIWSPSKSALNAVQTSGWIWIALPSTSCGANAWMPRRRGGCAQVTSTGGSVVQRERRADHDDGAPRVVDALAEQVLPEPALLALEHVGQRLERAVARPGHRPAAAPVVEQRVHGLLEHPLLVVDDDLGRAEVQQPLQPVVPVDDPAVQVVQVGGGEPAAVELHHRPQVRRDHRDAVEDHAQRAVGGVEERGDDLEPLQRAGLALALAGADGLPQVRRLGLEVEAADPLLDGLGAHAAAEVAAEPVAHLAVQQLVTLQVLDLEPAEPVPDLLDPVDLAARPVADLPALPVGALPHLAARVTLGARRLELGQGP